MGAPFWAHLPFEVHSPTYHVTAVLSKGAFTRRNIVACNIVARNNVACNNVARNNVARNIVARNNVACETTCRWAICAAPDWTLEYFFRFAIIHHRTYYNKQL